jgi:hypothetical protein
LNASDRRRGPLRLTNWVRQHRLHGLYRKAVGTTNVVVSTRRIMRCSARPLVIVRGSFRRLTATGSRCLAARRVAFCTMMGRVRWNRPFIRFRTKTIRPVRPPADELTLALKFARAENPTPAAVPTAVTSNSSAAPAISASYLLYLRHAHCIAQEASRITLRSRLLRQRHIDHRKSLFARRGGKAIIEGDDFQRCGPLLRSQKCRCKL